MEEPISASNGKPERSPSVDQIQLPSADEAALKDSSDTTKTELIKQPHPRHSHFYHYGRIFGERDQDNPCPESPYYTRDTWPGKAKDTSYFAYLIKKNSSTPSEEVPLGFLFGQHQRWKDFLEVLHNFASYKVATSRCLTSTEDNEDALIKRHPQLYFKLHDQENFSFPPKRGILTLILPVLEGETLSNRCHVLTTTSVNFSEIFKDNRVLTLPQNHFLDTYYKLQRYKKGVASNDANLCILLPPPKEEFPFPSLDQRQAPWEALPWEVYTEAVPMMYPDRVHTLVLNLSPSEYSQLSSYFLQVSSTHSRANQGDPTTTNDSKPEEDRPSPPAFPTLLAHKNLFHSKLLKYTFQDSVPTHHQTPKVSDELFLKAENILFPPDPTDEQDQTTTALFRASATYKRVQAFLTAMALLESECFFCFEHHSPEYCKHFGFLSIEERWSCVLDRIQLRKFCIICFSNKHVSHACQVQSCGEPDCHQKPPHHKLLH